MAKQPVKGNKQDQDQMSLRERIFDSSEPKSMIITFFGQEVELRQPSTKRVLDLRRLDSENPGMAAAEMIINYVYEPGTKNLVFESTDSDMILGLPFGDDMSRMNQAIGELTNIDVKTEIKN